MTHKSKPEYVRIAITQPDGGVAVMQFVTLVKRHENDPGFAREPTPENIEAEIAKSQVPCTSWRIVDDAEIPEDRTFRAAWVDGGDAITHDMEKARAIQLDRLRGARGPKLAQLDMQWMKATGQKKTAEADAIEAQRQTLRDIPQTLDLSKAETVEQLKEMWPEALR